MMTESSGRLRLMGEPDLEQVLQWRNSERIRKNMFSDHIITFEEHVNWYRQAIENNRMNTYMFEYENKPAGAVNFSSPDRNHNSYWGFYLGRDDLPKGTGSIMGRLAIDLAFRKLGIRKLCAEVIDFNEASLRLHQKLGFREEGVLERHVLKDGKYENVVCFALFSANFEHEVVR